MLIRMLWKMWDDEALELLAAMDDGAIDVAGWSVWDDACAAARKRYDITEGDTREVLIDVPYSEIVQAFHPPTLEGEVVSVPSERK